jgi:hypothetical protein
MELFSVNLQCNLKHADKVENISILFYFPEHVHA